LPGSSIRRSSAAQSRSSSSPTPRPRAETYDGILDRYGELLDALNNVFLGIFVAELLLRIASYGSRPQRFFREAGTSSISSSSALPPFPASARAPRCCASRGSSASSASCGFCRISACSYSL